MAQSMEFHGYTILEDGTIYNRFGNKVSVRVHDGRYEVRLVIDGKRKNFIVARLVSHLFNGTDINNKNICVIPKDGNKLNIHYSNLIEKERKNLIQGENHKKVTKLTDKDVQMIRELYNGKSGSNQLDKKGYSLNDLANMFNVSKGNIALIVRGKSRNKQEYKLK